MKPVYFIFIIFLVSAKDSATAHPIMTTETGMEFTVDSSSEQMAGNLSLLLSSSENVNRQYTDPERRNFGLRTGGFGGPTGGGIDLTINFTHNPIFGNMFFSIYGSPDQDKFPDAVMMAITGLTVGYETPLMSKGQGGMSSTRRVHLLNAHTNDWQLYARMGPGISVATLTMSERNVEGATPIGTVAGGRDVYDVSSTVNTYHEHHPGLHAALDAGMLFGRSSRYYIEMGGKIGWYPGLREMGLLITPQISIGIHLFGSGQSFSGDPYSY